MKHRASSVDHAEVERFSRHAADWWDARGPMAALHKFNPVRLGYIRDQAAERFGRDAKQLDCLKGLRMLDIGCGGGILSEPLARLGAQMVGADPSRGQHRGGERACAGERRRGRLPRHHGRGPGRDGERFDVVLAMEVVEHVADVAAFVQTCAVDGEAGRADDRRHAQPHAEELRAGHRRRRIRAALAAARHPSLGQVRHAERAGDSRSSAAACR